MIKRTVAVTLAALGLIAWVDPKTAAPEVSKDAAAQEARRQEVYVFKAREQEVRRVDDIAFRLEAANQDLCPERAPRLGVKWASAQAFPVKLRDVAAEALQLGDGLTLLEVMAGSPAAAAGLQPGDVLVSIGGEAVPTGDGAEEKLSKRVAELMGQSTTPVSVVVRRGGEARTFSVTPVMACAYGVAVEDKDVLNAYADGKAIHIYRPLLKLADSDEELALVIAHELAHNGQHHIQAEMHNGRILGVGGLLIDVAAAAGGVNTGGAFTKAGMRVGMAHAAPEFEAEADYVGMYYMARAGYPTDGVEDFWRKMAAESPEAIFIKTDHPTTPARYLAIAATSKEIEEKRAKGEPLVPNQKPAKQAE
jgi:membrane-associated protease RseP (regulator of RpoE activity)